MNSTHKFRHINDICIYLRNHHHNQVKNIPITQKQFLIPSGHSSLLNVLAHPHPHPQAKPPARFLSLWNSGHFLEFLHKRHHTVCRLFCLFFFSLSIFSGLSALLCISIVYSFLLLSSILLYGSATICLSFLFPVIGYYQ